MRPMTLRSAGLWLGVASLAACSSTTVVETGPKPRTARQEQGSTASRLGIPPGHLPRPGRCRVWYPGRPPGHQPPATTCAEASRTAPAGSWIVYRPSRDKKVVHVREVHASRPGVVVRVMIYMAASGEFVREGNREDEDSEENDRRGGKRRDNDH